MFEQQRRFLYSEAIVSKVMYACTAGSFFIGIALIMGASPFVIGVLGAIPFLANLVQIVGVYLVDRYENRRSIVYWSGIIGRGALLLMVVNFALPDAWQLPVFMVLALIHYAGGAIAGCAWNSWMHDYIPKQVLGSFFSQRMVLTTLSGIVATLVISFMWDYADMKFGEDSKFPYIILFGLAALFALVSNEMIRRIHHSPAHHRAAEPFSWKDINRPFRHHNFSRLIYFMGAWNFAFNLAAPFFTVYMLEWLHISMGDVVKYSILTQIVFMITLKIWGRYSDAFSNKTIIAICGPIFALSLLGWTFTTFPQPHEYSLLIVGILHVLIGISTAGINLANNNIALKLCPQNDNGTLYLATNSMFTSLCAGIAPLIGGALIYLVDDVTIIVQLQILTPASENNYPALALSAWDFFFTLAMILSFVTLAFLPAIEEEGHASKRLLVRSMMEDAGAFLHNISTITGLLNSIRTLKPAEASAHKSDS